MESVPLGARPAQRSVGGAAGTVLYLHGGGGVVGSPRQFRASLASVARAARADIYALDYRKAPEHPCPAAITDALDAYRELLARGHAPEQLALAGDSLGGGVALALSLAIKEADLPQPAGLALISPHVDMTLSGDSFSAKAWRDPVLRRSFVRANVRAYIGSLSPEDPRCSPLFGDLRGIPPLLIQSGSEDIIFSDSVRLAERAREAGVQVRLDVRGNGLFHAFQWFPGSVAEATPALADIATFLRECWRAQVPVPREEAGRRTAKAA